MTLVFALAFVGLGAGIYWGVKYFRGGSQGGAPALPFQTPQASGQGKPHPLQKHIEVTGLRFLQDDRKRTVAKFLVVNHSEADISSLAGKVTIWGRTQKSEEDPVGTISFELPSLGPNEAKEVNAPVDTSLRVYELPDWQNVTAELEITSP
jgi:hypothetical protein